jgi:hypothetical protein
MSNPVSGVWALTLQTQRGPANPTLTLSQSGEALSGSYKGQIGEGSVSGTLQADAIDFTVKMSAMGRDFEIRYTGKVEGDSMSGSVALGQLGNGSFTGKKQS